MWLTIHQSLYEFCKNIDLFTLLCCCLAILIIINAILIIVAVKSANFTTAKKVGVSFATFAVVFFVYGVEYFSGVNSGGHIILAVVNAIFNAVIFMVGRVKKSFKKEQIDLARLIDSKLKFAKNLTEQGDVKSTINQRENFNFPHQRQEKSFCELNLAHVKNIIERLNYFPLNQADKKQVHELELNILEAESHEQNPQLKSRLNENLGWLLKIMSKYGV